MLSWLSSRLRTAGPADGGRRPRRLCDRPPTPLPARRRPQRRHVGPEPAVEAATGGAAPLPGGAFRMLSWLSSRLRTAGPADGGRRPRRLSERPPTPMPARRRRPRLQRRHVELDPAAEAATGGTERLPDGAFRVGPRPRIVHFDLVDSEEDAVAYEYYPPGVAAPPSRWQLFLSRPRKPRNRPAPPSDEVQLAVAQIKAEIQVQENPPPRIWFGRIIQYYQVKRSYRRIYGKASL